MFQEIGEAGDAVGASAWRQCASARRARAASARPRSAAGRDDRARLVGLLRALSQISRRDRHRRALRLDRPVDRHALSCADAAAGRRLRRDLAIRTQPRHRRDAARGARGGALAVALVNDVASPLASEAEAVAAAVRGSRTFGRRDQIDDRGPRRRREPGRGLARGSAARGRDRPSSGDLRAQAAPPPAAMLERLASAPKRFRARPRCDARDRGRSRAETQGDLRDPRRSLFRGRGAAWPGRTRGPGFPVIAFLPSDVAREAMLATLARLAEMGATVIAIEAGGTDDAHRLAAAKVEATLLEPVVMIHRFYRLAEALARAARARS